MNEDIMEIDGFQVMRCCDTPMVRSRAYLAVVPSKTNQLFDFFRIAKIFKPFRFSVCTNCNKYHALTYSVTKLKIMEAITKRVPEKNLKFIFTYLTTTDKGYLEEMRKEDKLPT